MKYPSLLLAILLGLPMLSFSQEQQKYLNGKELFKAGRYSLAMETFRELTNPEVPNGFNEYASFYYALSAYHDGQLFIARDMFLQIESRYYQWRKMDEVDLWLTKIYFELDDFSRALEISAKIVSDQVNRQVRNLKAAELKRLDDLDDLKTLMEQFPNDSILAIVLVQRMSEQPMAVREIGLMESLVNKFDLNRSVFNVPDYSNNEKKASYNIAVIMPFMYNSLSDTRAIVRNSLVTSLYQGMLLAVDDLVNIGKQVNLFCYDTQRSEVKTSKILQNDEIQSMDLIIGPLYPEPSRVVSEFSYDYNINMINPLSSNGEVMGNNPYSFLYKSSTETQANATANFSKKTFSNKTAIIIYEQNKRDSLFACIYKEELEKDSFNIIWFKGLNETNTRQTLDSITATYERDLIGEELDSLLELENYPMNLRHKEHSYDPDEWYEELLVIAPESVGHIMTASGKALFAANSISAVAVRGDRIPLIGREEWLYHPSAGFEQMEKLGTYMVAPTFYNENSSKYKALKESIIKRFKVVPNQYHVIGFDMVLAVGELLHSNGKYFQVGIRNDQSVNSRLLPDLQFGNKNDNQIVPIIRFRDSNLIRVDQ